MREAGACWQHSRKQAMAMHSTAGSGGWRVSHRGCEEPALLVVEGWLDGSARRSDGAVRADEHTCQASSRELLVRRS